MKRFLITIDTEGDNLWCWHEGEKIHTENAKYINRFQELCEKYSFVPTYLVDYEMAESDILVEALKGKAKLGKCEIGMHLHAWNSPPAYELENKFNGQPFITEYPKSIVYEKHKYLKEYIENRFEIKVESYRAGRWATNNDLFESLAQLGIIVDCSITPGINHCKNKGMSIISGNDYSKASLKPSKHKTNIIEIPMTTMKVHWWKGPTFKRKVKNLVLGEELWLRTAVSNFDVLLQIVKRSKKQNYLEFMIHSSELMPGGSPYFHDEKDIERHYDLMEQFFEYLASEYSGISVSGYAKEIGDTL